MRTWLSDYAAKVESFCPITLSLEVCLISFGGANIEWYMGKVWVIKIPLLLFPLENRVAGYYKLKEWITF